jgi:hypothetical protein
MNTGQFVATTSGGVHSPMFRYDSMSDVCWTNENDLHRGGHLGNAKHRQNCGENLIGLDSNCISTERKPLDPSFSATEALPQSQPIEFWQILPDSSSQFWQSARLKNANRRVNSEGMPSQPRNVEFTLSRQHKRARRSANALTTCFTVHFWLRGARELGSRCWANYVAASNRNLIDPTLLREDV